MAMKSILLLYKSSTFEYCRRLPRKGRPDPEIMRRFEETHAAHYRSLGLIEQALKSAGLRYKKIMRGKIRDYRAFDMVITVGGDGTFLEAARYSRRQTLLGINSDPKWSVGRLCAVTADTFPDRLQEILSGTRQPVELNRLCILTNGMAGVIHFLNDVLIAHANPASQSRYILQINGTEEEQRGSGIWISSASGSTGAILSSGGKAQAPGSRDIQYRPRELYRGWTNEAYRFCGGILPPETKISLTSLMAEGMIFIDGSHLRIPFRVSETAEIRQSEYPLRVL